MSEPLVRVSVSVGDLVGVVVLGSIVVSELNDTLTVSPILAV